VAAEVRWKPERHGLDVPLIGAVFVARPDRAKPSPEEAGDVIQLLVDERRIRDLGRRLLRMS
jgi:hypothetical protein